MELLPEILAMINKYEMIINSIKDYLQKLEDKGNWFYEWKF